MKKTQVIWSAEALADLEVYKLIYSYQLENHVIYIEVIFDTRYNPDKLRVQTLDHHGHNNDRAGVSTVD